uniref:Uncharacterized protein n=1 Tax=Nelumbo nucifera TaxID=4432 RepID=A0A822YSV3_NELNU|nr:TPA_asm: hypothetical protein HUJ06_012727 [Nelumbo nucifera]
MVDQLMGFLIRCTISNEISVQNENRRISTAFRL